MPREPQKPPLPLMSSNQSCVPSLLKAATPPLVIAITWFALTAM